MGNEFLEVGMGREANIHYTPFFVYVKVSHVQKSNGRKEGGKDGGQGGAGEEFSLFQEHVSRPLLLLFPLPG